MKPIIKPSTTTIRSTTTTTSTTRSTTSLPTSTSTTKVDHNPNNIEIGTLNVDHSIKNDGLKDIVDQNLNEIDSDYLVQHKNDNNKPVIEQIFDIRALLRHELKNMIGKSQFRNPNSVDTQINIETLNVDIGTLNMDNTKQQCPVRDINEVLLGNDDNKKTGGVEDDVLSNVVKNYYTNSISEIENDRRKYSGKHKNSPMFIKFVNE